MFASTVASSLAGSSKEKAKLRAKLQGDVKQVEAAVKLYNEVVPFGTTERAATLTAANIVCAEPVFPWAAEIPAGEMFFSSGGSLKKIIIDRNIWCLL